jgi:hypothetical protein
MTVTSIDDIVELGIHNVISGMDHLARCIQSRAGAVAMHCRRATAVIALIAFGFLFRLEFLLVIAITPLVIGAVSFSIKRAIKVWQDHRADSNRPLAQASTDVCRTAPGLHGIIYR